MKIEREKIKEKKRRMKTKTKRNNENKEKEDFYFAGFKYFLRQEKFIPSLFLRVNTVSIYILK